MNNFSILFNFANNCASYRLCNNNLYSPGLLKLTGIKLFTFQSIVAVSKWKLSSHKLPWLYEQHCWYGHHFKALIQSQKYREISNISRTKHQNLNVFRLGLQCPNYIWVISNLTAYESATYIRDLTVFFLCIFAWRYSDPIQTDQLTCMFYLYFMYSAGEHRGSALFKSLNYHYYHIC